MPKTPIDKLQAAINKALEEYAGDTTKTVADLSKEFTQKGVQAVKAGSKVFGGTGKYAAGWTSKFETGRLSAQGTIYNGRLAYLTFWKRATRNETADGSRGGSILPLSNKK